MEHCLPIFFFLCSQSVRETISSPFHKYSDFRWETERFSQDQSASKLRIPDLKPGFRFLKASEHPSLPPQLPNTWALSAFGSGVKHHVLFFVFWFRDFVINYSAPMESNTVLLDSMGKDFWEINSGKAGRIRRKTQITERPLHKELLQ